MPSFSKPRKSLPDSTRSPVLFFDLDGPLLDVSGRYVVLHQALLNDLGERGLEGETYWQRKRARISEESLLAEIGLERHASFYTRARLERIESAEFLIHDRIWPWALPTLEVLSHRHDLVIVTARARREALLKQLESLALIGFFEEILSEAGGINVAEQKAALIHNYLARQGRSAEGYWIIGDTEADIGAGRILGLHTVAVLSGIRDAAHLAEEEPDFLLNDIRELPLVLEGTNPSPKAFRGA